MLLIQKNNTYGKFYKSYISDVKMICYGVGINGFMEKTFRFKYKGYCYEVAEKCTGPYSLRYEFYLKLLKEEQ